MYDFFLDENDVCHRALDLRFDAMSTDLNFECKKRVYRMLVSGIIMMVGWICGKL